MLFFFFHDTATTEIYTYGHTRSLHDALPISGDVQSRGASTRSSDALTRQRAGSRPVALAKRAYSSRLTGRCDAASMLLPLRTSTMSPGSLSSGSPGAGMSFARADSFRRFARDSPRACALSTTCREIGRAHAAALEIGRASGRERVGE